MRFRSLSGSDFLYVSLAFLHAMVVAVSPAFDPSLDIIGLRLGSSDGGANLVEESLSASDEDIDNDHTAEEEEIDGRGMFIQCSENDERWIILIGRNLPKAHATRVHLDHGHTPFPDTLLMNGQYSGTSP